MAKLDVADSYSCVSCVCLPGRVTAGELVRCPSGDHEHRVLGALHVEVVGVTLI